MATETQDAAVPSWAGRLSESRAGIALLSMMESTVVPVPLEAIIAPLMISYTRRAIVIATAALVGCLVGSALFYWVGRLALDPVVLPALQWLGLEEQFRDLRQEFESEGNAFLAVFLISVSPAPMQLATLGAGTTKVNFFLYMGAIAVSRGLRYYGLGLLCRILGERIAHLQMRKRVTVPLAMLVLVGLWGIYRFVV